MQIKATVSYTSTGLANLNKRSINKMDSGNCTQMKSSWRWPILFMLLNCTIIRTTVPNSFLHFRRLFVVGRVPTSGHVTLISPMSVSAYLSFHCKHKNLIKMFLCLELWFLFFLMPIKLTQLTKNESFDEYKLWTVRNKKSKSFVCLDLKHY